MPPEGAAKPIAPAHPKLEQDLAGYSVDVRMTFEAIDTALRQAFPTCEMGRLTRGDAFMAYSYKFGRKAIARLDPKGGRGEGFVMAMIPKEVHGFDVPPPLERSVRPGSANDFVRIRPEAAEIGAAFVVEMARAMQRWCYPNVNASLTASTPA